MHGGLVVKDSEFYGLQFNYHLVSKVSRVRFLADINIPLWQCSMCFVMRRAPGGLVVEDAFCGVGVTPIILVHKG